MNSSMNNGGNDSSSYANGSSNGVPTSNPSYVDLHELAKGWKAAIARATDPATRHECKIKNDRGNLPLHSAASFRSPIEVTEALLESYPEAASLTNNYGNLALHFTAWKKGPLDVEKLLLKIYPEGAAQKNNHGNLPLHYAAHYNAPLEVVEALYNAYPDAANQKNNDSNTPLDLAIADGASPNVVALLQGKSVPPSDDEMYNGAKSKCERMEKELQRYLEGHDSGQEDLETVLSLLMDVRDGHPHALFSAGIDPGKVTDVDSLLEQVTKASEEERLRRNDYGAGDTLGNNLRNRILDEDNEIQQIEDAIVPPDDDVEVTLSQIVGLDALKNQIRGMRRTIEMDKMTDSSEKPLPRHLALVGNAGVGKTFVARLLLPLMYKMGAVPTPNYVEVSRDELVDRRSEARTIQKTRQIMERASGGVLFVDEAYTLLPSDARSPGRDHGAAALKELARALPKSSPMVILAGYAGDLQRVLNSDLGFKGHFLLRVELPDPSPVEIARMFLMKLNQKGYVIGDGVTVEYVAKLIANNTEEEWRMDRNARISSLLVQAVRTEIKRKTGGASETASISPLKPAAQVSPSLPPDDVMVTVEDLQNAIGSL
uniref:AAA+ ATPase domain-containing protein n=2 Tax=Ditylum brightwellii TaxID=49249 RepID=A0A7S4QXR4_9STRA